MQWHFGPFRLDLANTCLWRAEQPVPLRPKTFDLLVYLVTHAGQLLTKEALLDAIWPETAVGDGVLKTSMGELRKALGETAKAPQWITTVHGRGYRFVAPVTVVDPVAPPVVPVVLPTSPPSLAPVSPPLLMERESVLQRLHAAWTQARQGRRQVIFVTGEAGIGKTAVAEAFATQVCQEPAVALAYGQCVEHYGAGEAYLPVLEALEQLCRGPAGAALVALLHQQAPTWLVQLPWLLSAAHREQLQYELQGTTRERMLREFAAVVDALTAETPLVLVLEDLHWSDYATLDLLALLARRRTPARFLVVGTCWSAEALVHHHPLRTVMQDLQRHGDAIEIPLALLSPEAVAAYLAVRFPQRRFPAELAPWLHTRTDGQPLYLVTLVQAFVAQGVLQAHNECWTVQASIETLAREVPEGLRQMLEQQITRLPLEEQRVLEVASVAGAEFVAAAVAAGLDADADSVEECCEALVVQQFLHPLGVTTWPNGTVATRYAFVHALYQQVVYERLGAGRRVRLHQRLGECLEAAYGAQAGEVAAELAEHFVRGQDVQRAVPYLQQAAENAAYRAAPVEAIRHLSRGLEVLITLPETPERLQQELDLQVPLGGAWAQNRGWSAPEVGQVYARARELCRRLGAPPQLPVVLLGQFSCYTQRAEWQTARELAEHLLTLAQRQADPALLLSAHYAFGLTLFFRGEVAAAHVHLAQGSALYVPAYHRALVTSNRLDPGVTVRCYTALSLWLLGAPEQALAQMHEARTLAQELSHTYSLAVALQQVTRLHPWRRDVPATLTWTEALIALSTEHGFEQYLSHARLLHGWALVVQGQAEEGLDQMRQSLTAYLATGAAIWRPYFLALLAEGYGQVGATDEGLRVLAEALAGVEKTGERVWEAELHRLTGELLLRQAVPDTPQAETCLHQALAVARQQQAKSLELRAAMSLSRLWQQQGKQDAARQLLTEVYSQFTEGFDTLDLQEAKALLELLA
jgi:predicted ATPase/DNA-binding winged helix-turn-helix (wHTH) protein